MAKYLIDANLPYYFSLWSDPNYIHVKDLADTWTDEIIWHYAKQNQLIIVTKDADFSSKLLVHGVPPKVIHIRVGNLKMNEFFKVISTIWPDVDQLIETNNLINIYLDKIEVIR